MYDANARRRERYASEPEYRKRASARAKLRRSRLGKTLNQLKQQTRLSRPEARLLESAKARAKERGLPFDITIHDIAIPSVCPLDGLPFDFNRSGKGPHPRSPSLDCIVPTLGYVKGNIAVISFHWNRLKCTMTADDLRRLLAYIEGTHHDSLSH